MDALIEALRQFVSDPDHPLGLAILAGSAGLEYVFPPFPGDTITAFGAVLIAAYGWSFSKVFAVVMLGNQVGAMLDFYIGLRWQRARRSREKTAGRLDRLVERFKKRGPALLLINRFVPAARPGFFIAAGLAGMRPWPVFFYSAISSALWTGVLFGLGSLVGDNFHTLLGWVRRYTLVAAAIVGAIALVFAWRHVRRRARTP